MQTVNFFMGEILDTMNPELQLACTWVGRATITQETDYDDSDQPFSVDVAEITDLFFKVGADVSFENIREYRRASIPNPSYKSQMFMARLRESAILAYHNPKLQPVEMPDEI